MEESAEAGANKVDEETSDSDSSEDEDDDELAEGEPSNDEGTVGGLLTRINSWQRILAPIH